ncbi:hypothetical protein B4144_4001 [Bacillus atrophaeus]|nr:hypothetical protein B4144_4001 [Bacillus atrophaeus]
MQFGYYVLKSAIEFEKWKWMGDPMKHNGFIVKGFFEAKS